VPNPAPTGIRSKTCKTAAGSTGKSGTAVSAELLGGDLVQSVLDDLETSPLEEKEVALAAIFRQSNQEFALLTVDIDQLRAAGWNDEAIFYTISVCALFNFYNRWVTASGIHALSDEGHRRHGKVLAQKGYDSGSGNNI